MLTRRTSLSMNRIKSLWKTLAAASASAGQESFELLANFTPRAQQVLALAHKEADRFHHHFIGTEHVLLGLISPSSTCSVPMKWWWKRSASLCASASTCWARGVKFARSSKDSCPALAEAAASVFHSDLILFRS